MARPPLNPSLGDVQAALAGAIDELAQPPTRKERKNGWIEETRTEVSAYLQAIREDIDNGIPPPPRDLPSQVEVVRWLDAMGVSLGDPLNERVMSAFGVARRFAKQAATTS
jgi:hypothetical protein